jgi:hypothetical protein
MLHDRVEDHTAKLFEVVEGFNSEELDQGSEVFETVLDGCSRQAPAMYGLESAHGLESQGGTVLDEMRWLCNPGSVNHLRNLFLFSVSNIPSSYLHQAQFGARKCSVLDPDSSFSGPSMERAQY